MHSLLKSLLISLIVLFLFFGQRLPHYNFPFLPKSKAPPGWLFGLSKNTGEQPRFYCR